MNYSRDFLSNIRLGAACPANYNPADHYIQLLAGIPGREETTRHTIDTVCTAFAKSEIGCKLAAEAENALYHEVRIYLLTFFCCFHALSRTQPGR